MKHLSINALRKLVLETVQEEKEHSRIRKILENSGIIIKEEANVGDFRGEDQIPLKLSHVNSDIAELIATSGQGDTDKITVAPASWAVNDLKPSQTSMNLGKGLWFALGMENGSMWGSGGPGGKTDAFVSKDNYLMDGHHRWIATGMVDPSAPVEGFQVAWPAKELIAVLNTVTKGLLGVPQGKPGTGGFEQFKDKAAIKAELQLFANGEHPKYQSSIAGEDTSITALQVMENSSGKQGEEAIEAIAEKFYKNVGDMENAKNPPSSFPTRIDMPVIDDDHVTNPLINNAIQDSINALKTGKVDVSNKEGPEDYNQFSRKQSAPATGAYDPNEAINDSYIRRWHKLAGILTD